MHGRFVRGFFSWCVNSRVGGSGEVFNSGVAAHGMEGCLRVIVLERDEMAPVSRSDCASQFFSSGEST